METLKAKLQRLPSKKVPALALVVVAMAGMVMGVIAASITVTTLPYVGEIGTNHTNTGTMTVADNGLSVVSNVNGIANNSTGIFGANGTNKNIFAGSTFTAGNWIETIVFTDTATGDSSAHTVTIKINSGSAVPTGTPLISTVTLTLTGPGAGTSTGTITTYIDLGVATITAPLTVYVNST